jgi:hypothetical protein
MEFKEDEFRSQLLILDIDELIGKVKDPIQKQSTAYGIGRAALIICSHSGSICLLLFS